MINSSNYKIKNFNDLKISNENVYNQIEKYCNRIEILQNPRIYEEPIIMKIAEMRDNKKMLEKVDNKILQQNIEREELNKLKKIGSCKKLKPYKISNLQMYNNDTLKKLINSMKNVNHKVLSENAKKKKQEEKKPHKEITSSRCSNKVDVASNFQVLNMILEERKEKKLRVSVDDAFFNKEIYKQVKRSTMSQNSQALSKIADLWKTDNFRTPIKKMQSVTKEEEFETESSYNKDLKEKQNDERMKERGKIKKLCSDIKRMKPKISSEDKSLYSSSSHFKRKEVYMDELNIHQMNRGIKHRSLSNVKSLYMSPKKGKDSVEYSSDAGKKTKTILQECNKLITSQKDLLKSKTKQIEEHKILDEKQKMKIKYGHDNLMINELKKESGKYDEDTGVFLYSNKGYKLNNYERLYSSKYNVN